MIDFLRLIDGNAGGLRLKKGQGTLHLSKSAPMRDLKAGRRHPVVADPKKQ